MSTEHTASHPDDQTLELQEAYDLHHIQLISGEQILNVTSDHFMEWLPRIAPPLVLSLICVGIIILRSMGLRIGWGETPQFSAEWLVPVIGGIFLAVVLIWVFVPRSVGSKRSLPSGWISRLFLLLAFVAMAALVVLSWQGVPVVYTDPAMQMSLSEFFFDPVILVALLIALLGIGAAVYIYVESENDHLILTNSRVILSDRQVFGEYQIDQISLRDIQDVRSKSDTYLQYWLNYGTITVQSVRKTLVFKKAERATTFQEQVMAEVKALRNQRNAKDFREVIDTKVYGKPPAEELPQADLMLSTSPAILRRVLPDNPQIDEDGTITWRPHWVFLIIQLTKPVLFIVVSFLAIIVAAQFPVGNPLLGSGWTVVLMALVLVVFLGWAAYEVEDHVNDLYILTPTNIIDVEQKPWGPSDRRSASLSAVQNVTSKTTLVSRWWNYGDVFVETAGKGEFTFHKVPYPAEVVRMINNYQDEFRLGEKKRSLEDMALLLKYYHSEQLKQHPDANSGMGAASPADSNRA
jgi:cytoskeletal protein RodZ